jgi:signal transduction histidine kinase
MAQGTSTHGIGASAERAGAGQGGTDARPRRGGRGWRLGRAWIAGEPAAMQPVVLLAVAGLVLGPAGVSAWEGAAAGPGDPGLNAALLITAVAIAALIALRPRAEAEPLAPAAPQPRRSLPEADRNLGRKEDRGARGGGHAHDRPDPLLAQMHHELRTPLTAVIGFSDAMRSELHGPLGNARYQEYAAHISESGGRLLKASEDALAVAATMSALVADRRGSLRRQRLPAASLVREAWTASAGPASGRGVELALEDFDGLAVDCDWQATSLALQHLLGAALARTPPRGRVVVSMSRRDGAARVEIRAVAPPGHERRGAAATARRRPDGDATGGGAGGGLRVVLARSLLEMQGAGLGLPAQDRTEGWSVHIAFPAAATQVAGPVRRVAGPATAAAAARRPAALPASRAGSAAASAARASAGSRAARPA